MAQVRCAQRGCPGQQGRRGQGILSKGEREDIMELRSQTEILNPGRIHHSYLGSFVERLISPHCPYPLSYMSLALGFYGTPGLMYLGSGVPELD